MAFEPLPEAPSLQGSSSADAKLDVLISSMSNLVVGVNAMQSQITQMVTKEDLKDVLVKHREETHVYVHSQLEPLAIAYEEVQEQTAKNSEAVVDLSQRMKRLEKRLAPVSRGSRRMPDVGRKQVAFKNIDKAVSAEQRLKDVENFVKTNFPNVRTRDCFNIHTGAYTKDQTRELTGVTIVEFSTPDVQRMVLQKVVEKKLKLQIGGKNVEIKSGKSDSAISRDDDLRSAAKTLTDDPRNTGKVVKCEHIGSRGVTVDGVYCFDQPKGQDMGKFVSPFEDLETP